MKPTLQQEEILRKYLREALLYRETYEEVYDHVLTALEQKSAKIPFQEAMNQVLNDDFGGGKGLVEMEKKWSRSIVKATINQQRNHFKSNFKFPGFIYTFILFLTVYFIVTKIVVASFIVVFLAFFGILIPGLIISTRYLWLVYFTSNNKKSIKDKMILLIVLRCNSFLLGLMIWFPNKQDFNIINRNWGIIDDSFVFSLAITISIIYILSYIRLYNEKFKVYITK